MLPLRWHDSGLTDAHKPPATGVAFGVKYMAGAVKFFMTSYRKTTPQIPQASIFWP
jgi:hypothetical protein